MTALRRLVGPKRPRVRIKNRSVGMARNVGRSSRVLQDDGVEIQELKDTAVFRFRIGPEASYAWAEVSIDGDALVIRSSNVMSIRPEASNSIRVRVEARRAVSVEEVKSVLAARNKDGIQSVRGEQREDQTIVAIGS